MPVGVLLTLEIEIPGEPAASPAVGRVTWVREAAAAVDGKPAGMGVTFIDVDDTVLSAIGRLLAHEARAERDEQPRKAIPSREQTVLGVGVSKPSSNTTAAPLASAAPAAMAHPGSDLQRDKEEARRSLHDVDDLPEWPDEPPPQPESPVPPIAEKSPPIRLIATKEPRGPEGAQAPGAETSAIALVVAKQRHEPDRPAPPAPERSLPIDLVASTTPATLGPEKVPEASVAVERSIPIGLVSDKAGSPSAAPAEPRAASTSPPAGKSKRTRVGGLVLLLSLAALAGSGYGSRARLRPWVASLVGREVIPGRVSATPPVISSASSTLGRSSPPPSESATVTTAAPMHSASANVDDVDAGARRKAAAADGGVGPSKNPAHRLAPHAPKHHPAAPVQSGDSAQ